MNKKLLKSVRLEELLIVAELAHHDSFPPVAEKFNREVSGISRALSKAEKLFDAKMYERSTGRGSIIATAAGESINRRIGLALDILAGNQPDLERLKADLALSERQLKHARKRLQKIASMVGDV